MTREVSDVACQRDLTLLVQRLGDIEPAMDKGFAGLSESLVRGIAERAGLPRCLAM